VQSGIDIYLMDIMVFKHLINQMLKRWLHAIVGVDYFYGQHGETDIFRTQLTFVMVSIYYNKGNQSLQECFGYHQGKPGVKLKKH